MIVLVQWLDQIWSNAGMFSTVLYNIHFIDPNLSFYQFCKAPKCNMFSPWLLLYHYSIYSSALLESLFTVVHFYKVFL